MTNREFVNQMVDICLTTVEARHTGETSEPPLSAYFASLERLINRTDVQTAINEETP